MTVPTPYSELNAVVVELVSSIEVILGETFVGGYLQGSFAVGDFDEHSDVDFVIATHHELSELQVQALQAMHERIYRLSCPWAQHLEGSYFPKDMLRHYQQSGKALWYLDHGAWSLVQSDHCNTVVVRWALREHGVCLAGPMAASLVDPIPVEVLRQDIFSTLCGWGQQILDHPEQYSNRFYQTYIVLNYCRMLHDLRAGRAGSKVAGARWAKATLDPCWADLIDRAWSGRPNPAVSVRQPADPQEFARTLDFVGYIMSAAREFAVVQRSAGVSSAS